MFLKKNLSGTKSSLHGPPKRKTLLDDDDDELPVRPQKKPFVGLDPLGKDEKASESQSKEQDKIELPRKSDEEEVDPLDAFMSNIDTLAPSTSNPSQVERYDFAQEEEDEEYRIQQQNYNKQQQQILDGNGSDDEVYATAKAIDQSQKNALDDDDDRRKDIGPLPEIDHDSIEYPSFEKNFYTQHADISNLRDEQVSQLRNELNIRVSGFNPPRPCISFAHFGFEQDLLNCIIRAGFSQPTDIQKQAVPIILSGRDVIGIAKTGSGKTAAFLWPLITHVLDQPPLEKGDGPIALILAPTRELTHQIYVEAKKFGKPHGLTCAEIFGGINKTDQFKELRAGVDILIATPGRLIDMIKMKATNLQRVTFLVLDEADQMFALGFEPQVRSIVQNVRPDRQTVLFSATFKKQVESLARQILSDPVRITVGIVGQSNADVTQYVSVLTDDSQKWNELIQLLPRVCSEGSVMIFVARKEGVEQLSTALVSTAGYPALGLHGDMLQAERDRILREFKSGKAKVLVCTDVASRGLDIKSVKSVINYDVAKDIDSHVHRIGRTGRSGEKGNAYTFLTQKEDRFAGFLVQNLEEAGQVVSPLLLQLAERNHKFRQRRARLSSAGRGRGRGSGRGRGGFQRPEEGYVNPSGQRFVRPPPAPVSRGEAPSSFHRGGFIQFQKASTSATGSTSFTRK